MPTRCSPRSRSSSDGAFAIAAAMNEPAAPDFIVWRTSDARNHQNGFTWTLVDALSVGTAPTLTMTLLK